MQKNYVISDPELKQMIPLFNTKRGKFLLYLLKKFSAIDKVNALYARCCHATGSDFADALLKDLNIQYRITNPEQLEKLPQKGFITVSNHPFGALDGIILIAMMGKRYPDFKVMVNSILAHIEALRPSFIEVEPYGNKHNSRKNLEGIRQALRHVEGEHPLGFFPAGSVSKIRPNLRVQDLPWAESITKLIQQVNQPVVPIYFHGSNSLFFNLLGMISWRIRMVRMPAEVFLKRNKTIRITIGEIIPAEHIQAFTDPTMLRKYLRKQTFIMRDKG